MMSRIQGWDHQELIENSTFTLLLIPVRRDNRQEGSIKPKNVCDVIYRGPRLQLFGSVIKTMSLKMSKI